MIIWVQRYELVSEIPNLFGYFPKMSPDRLRVTFLVCTIGMTRRRGRSAGQRQCSPEFEVQSGPFLSFSFPTFFSETIYLVLIQLLRIVVAARVIGAARVVIRSWVVSTARIVGVVFSFSDIILHFKGLHNLLSDISAFVGCKSTIISDTTDGNTPFQDKPNLA